MGPKRKHSDTITVNVKTLMGETISVEISPSAHLHCKNCYASELARAVHDKRGWQLLFAVEAEREYYRFLELKCVVRDFQDNKLCAPPLIDAVWVIHMQDNQRYEAFCSREFDRCGATGEPQRLQRILKQNTPHALHTTKIAYEARFGEPPNEKFWASDAEPVMERTYAEWFRNRECNSLAKELADRKGFTSHFIAEMRLCYKERIWFDTTKSLEDLEVVDGATIHWLLSLRGC